MVPADVPLFMEIVMTMFEELFALATSAPLAMTVSADEKSGRMTVNVVPKPRKDVSEPALAQPLSLTATPQEFDMGFIEELRGYREARESLAKQARATREVIEAAEAASVKKARDATAKATGSKPGVAVAKPTAMAPSSGSRDQEAGADDNDDDNDNAADAGAAPATAPVAVGSDSYDLFG